MKAALYFCFLSVFLTTKLAALAQPSKIDSLEKVLALSSSDTNRVIVLNQLAGQYRNWTSNLDKSRAYAQQALMLAEKLRYENGIGQSYTSIGNYYYRLNQNQKAQIHYGKALHYFQKAGRNRGIGIGYGNLAMIYEDAGNYPKALEYYYKSLKIAEKLNDKINQGLNLSSMGVLMQNQKKYKEALAYNFKAIKLLDLVNDQPSKAFALNCVGNIYREQKQYDKAINYLQQALAIFNKYEIARGQVGCYNNLGLTAYSLRQYDQALAYHQKALAISQSEGYNSSAVMAMHGIAAVLLHQKKTAEVIAIFKKSLLMAAEHNLALEKLEAYQGLTQAFALQKDYAAAFATQTKAVTLKDSIYNDQNTQEIAQLQANYQIEKKQAEIELMKKDQERDNLRQNAIGGGLLACLIIAGLILSRQRLKIRQDQLLVEKSKEVAEKNKLLESQAQVLEQQAHALEQQTQKLRELDQAKSTFFANISHEFRTPLTLILGNLSNKIARPALVQQEIISMPRQEVQVMHRNAKRLLELINQLLDLSKLESGQLSLQPQPGDLNQFFRVLTGSFSSLAEYRHIRFDFYLPEKVPYFRFDADKFEKIFSNLLSNAFKFSPDGGTIMGQVELFPVLPGRDWLVQVTVKDCGPGIATDQLDKVFDRFYQGPRQYSDQQGTGIGLALVKELVALHGGKVWAENNATSGAQFTVRLPLLQVPDEEAKKYLLQENIAATITSTNEGSLGSVSNNLAVDAPVIHSAVQPVNLTIEKPVLLIVEDNTDLRQYIRRHLEDQYTILESENGRLGLEEALTQVPDLVISDLMMPEMDGITLCRHLKTDERISHIPIILLTALATDESKLQGLETGADEYLTKPFNPQELQIRVRNLVESRKKLRERFGKEIWVKPKEITVSSVDEKFLEKALKVVEEKMSDSDFGAEEFSREIGMSRMQLHRKLTALTGQSTSDFLRSMRLKRAAQLLQARAGNVSEVAFEVGFNSLSYFSKCFKEQFQVQPNEYLAQQEKSTPV